MDPQRTIFPTEVALPNDYFQTPAAQHANVDGRYGSHIWLVDMETLQACWKPRILALPPQNNKSSHSFIMFESQQETFSTNLLEEAKQFELRYQKEGLPIHQRVCAAIQALTLCHMLFPLGVEVARLKGHSMEDATTIRTIEGRAVFFLQNCWEKRGKAIEDDMWARKRKKYG